MTCDELYRRLTDHEDGILEGDVCAEVDRHLAECASCSEIRRDLQDLSRLCREQAAVELPVSVRRRIEGLLSSTA
jgi:hypothetical protein